MTIYRIDDNRIAALERTTFEEQGLHERRDLQALLKAQIDVISSDTLIVAEEFGEWEDSRRRIDLLGVGKDGNLVVIELKRTEDGGHMDLQAIRYAAMISTLTFDQLVEIYQRYLSDNGIEQDATESLYEFLDWNDSNVEEFGQEVRIVLASAEFSKELANSVLWLNDSGLNIRCVRMHPYINDGQTLLDVQTIIPLPEAADYQTRVREKKQKEREARESARDNFKYDVSIAGETYQVPRKRWVVFKLISGLLANCITPDQLMDAIPWRRGKLFIVLDGELTSEQACDAITEIEGRNTHPRTKYFCDSDDEIFHINGKTYVFRNCWGGEEGSRVAEQLKMGFPQFNIEFKRTNRPYSSS